MHGCPHAEAESEVENFIIQHDPPYEIITGNSDMMQDIVRNILNKYKLDAFYRHPNNLGCLIVVDRI